MGWERIAVFKPSDGECQMTMVLSGERVVGTHRRRAKTTRPACHLKSPVRETSPSLLYNIMPPKLINTPSEMNVVQVFRCYLGAIQSE